MPTRGRPKKKTKKSSPSPPSVESSPAIIETGDDVSSHPDEPAENSRRQLEREKDRLELAIAQKEVDLLKKKLHDMESLNPVTASAAATPPVTNPATVSTPVGNLSDLLASNVPAAADPISAMDRPVDNNPRILLQPEIPGECLKIVDFVPKLDDLHVEEELAHSADGTTMYVRKGPKRIQAHEVSPAQWIVANARIQHALMTSGDLPPHDIADYLGYTAKIGHYATLYTWQSVMNFDCAYRQSQAALRFRWGSESQHLVNIHLKRR